MTTVDRIRKIFLIYSHIEQDDSILSLKGSNQILMWIENEPILIRSSLNLLYNIQRNSNFSVDDVTFVLDNSIYQGDID